MSHSTEHVVVTGLGAVTPLGPDVASTWAALLAGRSGVCKLSESWADELPVRIAALARTDPAAMIPAHQLRRACTRKLADRASTRISSAVLRSTGTSRAEAPSLAEFRQHLGRFR